jgi:hypothetical protein
VGGLFFNNQGLDFSNSAECKNPFPVRSCLWRIAWINDTAKFTGLVDYQVFSLAIMLGFGTSGATRSGTSAPTAHMF